MFETVDRQFPGAIWSLSIGFDCDRMDTTPPTWPDAGRNWPPRTARGTSAFDLERGHRWA